MMIDAALAVVSIQPIRPQICGIDVIAYIGASALRQTSALRVESFSKCDVAWLSRIAFCPNGSDSLHSSPSRRFVLDWIEILGIGGEFIGNELIREKRGRLPNAPL